MPSSSTPSPWSEARVGCHGLGAAQPVFGPAGCVSNRGGAGAGTFEPLPACSRTRLVWRPQQVQRARSASDGTGLSELSVQSRTPEEGCAVFGAPVAGCVSNRGGAGAGTFEPSPRAHARGWSGDRGCPELGEAKVGNRWTERPTMAAPSSGHPKWVERARSASDGTGLSDWARRPQHPKKAAPSSGHPYTSRVLTHAAGTERCSKGGVLAAQPSPRLRPCPVR